MEQNPWEEGVTSSRPGILTNRTDSCLLCCSGTPGPEDEDSVTLVDRNVRVIFILRKLLNLPPTLCSDLVQNYGHPADWVSLCSTCDDLVTRGTRLFDQINKLAREFDSVREKVRRVVNVKQEIREDDEDQSTDSATSRIRSYLASDTGFVGGRHDFGGEIYPDVLTKDEPDDAYEMNLDAEIPPPNFVTLKFHLDDNDAFEEEVVDPLAFQGDEILETFSSNDQHRKRRRKKICTKQDPIMSPIQDSDSDEDQEDYHNDPDYSDEESLQNAPPSPPPDLTLSWAQIMAAFPPPPPTQEDETFIPVEIKEKEIERLTGLAVKHGITSFPCLHCAKEISSIVSWKSHVDWCSGKTKGYRCETCEKVVKTKEGLENHILSSHTPREDLTCRGCTKFYPHWEDFDDHVKERPACGEYAIFCPHKPCKLAFSSEKVCEIHSFCRHSEITPFICDVPGCGKRYKNSQQLRRHVEMLHSEGKQSFICERCGKDFTLKSSLLGHIKIVHLTRDQGAPRFPCDICGREMVSEYKLKRHKEIHIDPEDAPHLCTLCGKRYRLPEYLHIHMRSHDPDRREKYSHYMPKKKKADGGEVKTGVAGAKIGRPKKTREIVREEEDE